MSYHPFQRQYTHSSPVHLWFWESFFGYHLCCMTFAMETYINIFLSQTEHQPQAVGAIESKSSLVMQSLLSYLQGHGWLKGNGIIGNPIPIQVKVHKSYDCIASCTACRNLYWTVSTAFITWEKGPYKSGNFLSSSGLMSFMSLLSLVHYALFLMSLRCFNAEEIAPQSSKVYKIS